MMQMNKLTWTGGISQTAAHHSKTLEEAPGARFPADYAGCAKKYDRGIPCDGCFLSKNRVKRIINNLIGFKRGQNFDISHACTGVAGRIDNRLLLSIGMELPAIAFASRTAVVAPSASFFGRTKPGMYNYGNGDVKI